MPGGVRCTKNKQENKEIATGINEKIFGEKLSASNPLLELT